jgi:hypothetical protein
MSGNRIFLLIYYHHKILELIFRAVAQYIHLKYAVTN